MQKMKIRDISGIHESYGEINITYNGPDFSHIRDVWESLALAEAIFVTYIMEDFA